MDIAALDKKLFAHLEKESLILNPVNVGFVLGIDADDALKLLDALVECEKLEKVSGNGMTATYRQVGHATLETTPGMQSVSAAKSSACLYQLILNVLIPGLGALIYKRFGFWLVLVALFAIPMMQLVLLPSFTKFFSILGFAIWYLVAVLGSISYYMKDPWGKK